MPYVDLLPDWATELLKWLLTYLLTFLSTLGGVWAIYRKAWRADRQQTSSEQKQENDDDRKDAKLYIELRDKVGLIEERADKKIQNIEERSERRIQELELRNAERLEAMDKRHNAHVVEMETRHARELGKVRAEMGLVIDGFSYLCAKIAPDHPDWVATANEIIAGNVAYKRGTVENNDG